MIGCEIASVLPSPRFALIGMLSLACVTGIHAADQQPKEILAKPFMDRSALETGLAKAQQAGVGPEALLEAQILFALFHDCEEADRFAPLLAELDNLRPTWRYRQCQLITDERMLQAIASTLKAKIARDEEDNATFETEARQALWLEPELSIVLNDWIETYHQEQNWKQQRAPLNMVLLDLNGQTHTLGELLQGHKALLLDFWATWCGPCIRGMPELEHRSEVLTPQGIYVASVSTQNIEKATAFREKNGYTFEWLVQPPERQFSRRFGIDSIPRVLLIGPDGQVLFNANPIDPRLPKVLADLGFELEGDAQ